MKEDKLIPRNLRDLIEEHNVDKVLDGEVILEVPLDKIIANPFQPRRIFEQEKIDELAESIKQHGVFQPIIVKKLKDNSYMIVSGERRFRASKSVGLESIPAIIRNYTEDKVAEIALAENLQREDLTPIEEAEAYQVVMNKLGITQGELAEKVGKSRSHVTNMLGLLKLPKEVQDLLLNKKLSMGNARSLSKLKDEKVIIELANKIIDENLNVRQVEELTKEEQKSKTITRKPKKTIYNEERNLLSKYFNAKIHINNNKIVIHAKDEKQLQQLLERLIKHEISNK
ncbi:MAG TPA: ParB/RepB/Spo0J family partition protein [Acholeplasmataceae bacterium]|nr:ParB/RepB/Spo0J family partition protein [Acholeplasmataceae bacterium]